VQINTRAAEEADSAEIFAWRNDPVTRQMSLTTAPVSLEAHQAWFAATLADETRCLLVCFDGTTSQKLAVVRFDLEGSAALMSINLNPIQRGKGLAQPCLRQALAFLSKSHPQVTLVRAEIKTENIPSRRSFEAVGFELDHETEDLRVYTLPIDKMAE